MGVPIHFYSETERDEIVQPLRTSMMYSAVVKMPSGAMGTILLPASASECDGFFVQIDDKWYNRSSLEDIHNIVQSHFKCDFVDVQKGFMSDSDNNI